MKCVPHAMRAACARGACVVRAAESRMRRAECGELSVLFDFARHTRRKRLLKDCARCPND